MFDELIQQLDEDIRVLKEMLAGLRDMLALIESWEESPEPKTIDEAEALADKRHDERVRAFENGENRFRW